MEERVLKLLELKDDEAGINSLIVNECETNPTELYPDYRDLEDLQRLVENCNTQVEFEDKIYEAWSDAISETQYDLARLIADKLKDKYSVDDISNSLFEHIQEYIYENNKIDLFMNKYLRQELYVNIFVTYNHSCDAFDDDLDYKTLHKFLTKLGYSQTKTLLKDLKNNTCQNMDPFLKSLQREMLNSYSNQVNLLCFIGKITIEEYYKIISNPVGTYITFPKDVTCGFVDPYCGGGSILGLELPNEYKIKGQNIYELIIERTKQKYSVDDIYGLTDECYKELKVK